MTTAIITWTLPATRESGLPLAVADIASVALALSADGGANFAPLGDVLSTDTQEFTVADLSVGDWQVQLVVLDTSGRTSQPVVALFNVPDDTPPGTVISVKITFV